MFSFFDNSELILIVNEQQIRGKNKELCMYLYLRENFRFDLMAETNLQKNLVNSSQDDIIYVDQQSNSSYKCPICSRLFRDPIVAQCGVSSLLII